MSMTTSFERIQILTDLFKQHHVKHIVFSPGSRNAPLVIGFRNDNYFETKTVLDERSAAFIALGMAQQLQEPVAICSTSGSATLNYAPAICEAYYQKIPLLILTADRPPEWIDQGEGQSINQHAIYHNYIEGSFNFPVDENPDTSWQAGRITNEAINLSKKSNRPVHINLPFREPLYQTGSSTSKRKKTELCEIERIISENEIIKIANKWNQSQKKLILCGLMPQNDSLNKALSSFSKDPSTVILTETTANLQADNFIPCIDRTLERIIGEPQMIPEIVVTIGGPIISKKIKSLFRKYNPSEHWHIEPTEATMDVFTSLTKIIPVDPAYFFNTLKDKTQIIQSSFQKIWMDQYHQSKKNHDDFIKSIEWSDLKAHQLIHEHIPEKANFQMGNSTAVRYVQLFEYKKDIQFNGNRGVSGIDGSTSTAMGAALVNDKLTLLVTGDLSFVYDINAFWNKTHPDNLKIIVVNNNGGGIFKIIPGPFSTPYGKEHFEAENPANLKHLAQAHNIEFLSANDIETTNKALKDLFNSKSTCILELETHHCNNEDVLKSYFEAIKN